MDWLVSVVGILIHTSKRAQGWISEESFEESAFDDGKCLGIPACVVRQVPDNICLCSRSKNIIAGSNGICIVFSSCNRLWIPGIMVAIMSSSVSRINNSKSSLVVLRVRITCATVAAIRITTINRAGAFKIRMVFC